MTRWLYTFICLLTLTTGLFGQQANSWINYSQYYYEIRIGNDGIVRLDYNALSNAGIPVSTIDPRNFQIFSRGQEQPIYVKGEADASFDPTDYIEFYTEANTAWLDSGLYNNVNNPNPYYSLISDSSSYYLTWNTSTANNRITVETDTSFSSYTPSAYYWKTSLQYYNSTYLFGKTNNVGGTESTYDATEGWMDTKIKKGAYKLKTFALSNLYASGPNAIFTGVVTGQSNYAQINKDHHLRLEVNSNVYLDTIYEGYQQINFSYGVPVSQLTASTGVKVKSVNDIAPSDPNFVDYHAIAYLKFLYPHTMNTGNVTEEYLGLNDHGSQSKNYLALTGFNGGANPVMYDVTNARRIPVVNVSGVYKALVPNAGGMKFCYVTDSANINYASLNPVFGSGKFVDYSTSAPDSAYIIITHSSLMGDASVYSSYRASTGYNPILMDIEQLYHQYAYGVRKHPLAIRYCVKDALANWSSDPHFLFLLGKSVKADLRRKSATANALDLVPTAGSPPSDVMLTAGLNGTLLQPGVPTGRVSASTTSDVTLYLNKIMDYEGAPRELWMKDVLHFAGGTNSSESATFVGYLDTYKSLIMDTCFGGNVTTFQKTSTAPIQITLSDSIKNMISRGVSIMTFFGHASATGGFDQNVDDPVDWGNYKRYPLVVGNACFAGDIHLDNTLSTSEKFVLINNLGAIGFISSVGLGVPPYVHAYSAEFFKRLSNTRYGTEVSKLMQETIAGIQGGASDEYIRAVCMETTFHGDPALKVNPAALPDFEVNSQSIYFDPGDVTTQLDSFDLKLIVTNNGKAVGDSIAVEITRSFPGNQYPDTVVIKVIKSTKYKDTLTFRFPVDHVRGVGVNTFSVFVDALNNVNELSEFNNRISASLLIRSGDIFPVYPHEYAIQPGQNITLKASTGLPFLAPKTYVFELDTNDSFSTPFKKSYKVTKNGAVVKWSPSDLQVMPDSQVYFWRVSPDSVVGGSYMWKESSFQYIPSRRGWGQAHFHQFKHDDFTFINYDKPNRKLSYVNTVQQLSCRTYGNPVIAELWDVLYKIDNDIKAYGGVGWPSGMHVAVLDSLTLEPWNSGAYKFGQLNEDSVGNKLGIFIFKTNSPTQMAAMANMLNDSVPNGNYILAYTWRIGGFSTWPAATMNAYLGIGADSIQYIGDSIPYIFFGRKGDPNSVIEVFGDSIRSRIDLVTNISRNASYGYVKSEVLGPATKWDSVFWRYHSLESPSVDSLLLNIYGVSMSGSETPIWTNIPMDSVDLNVNGKINASAYPFLRLETFMEDDSLKTAAQLDRWQVIYEGVPECALNPEIHYQFHADTVMQGEEVQLEIAIENIGDYDMDSLLIAYNVLSENNQLISVAYPRQKPLKKDSVFISSVTVPTANLKGACKLLVDVNPNNDQLEQYHFNNLGEIDFYVNADDVNPILDVTFDGVHILEGEIVSAKPDIVIQLTDENQFLALNDTSDFEVYLTNPSGQQQRIWFKDKTGADVLAFTPAQLPKNSCRIEWNPELTTDGIYRVKVLASDRSANASGDYGYDISFEVINKSTITNVVNYPNPFSTCTHFVFTLTGSVVPDNMQIQIMTVTGKLVKTIYQSELGPIRVGNNQTSYCWDGRDEYGDQLANGLYLYRVTTRLNSESIEHRDSQADKFFKKGFGKMYLIK